jgi:hypothetical protein
VVRDHRGGNRPVYVDHQESEGGTPIIRDHRQGSGPIIRDHREPAVRVRLVMHTLTVHNDLDWGAGEVTIGARVWRVNPGCPDDAHQAGCVTDLWKLQPMKHAADDGDVFQINASFPSPQDEMLGPGVSSLHGIPLVAGERYGFEIRGWEDDTFSDDTMGHIRGTLNEANGWGIGRETLRARDGSLPGLTGACVACPGNFSMDFSFQRSSLPDLRTKSIRIDQPFPERPPYLCATIENAGRREAEAFQVVMRQDGQVISTLGMAGLAASEAHETCQQAAPFTPGQHALEVAVDTMFVIIEDDEENNVFQQAYTASAPQTTTSSPSGPMTTTNGKEPEASAQADVRIESIRVRGDKATGESDCIPGKNDLVVTVKNTGSKPAGTLSIQLRVDNEDDEETTVAGPDAGKARDVVFKDVKLKKGDHTLNAALKVAADDSTQVASTNSLSVSCKEK